MKEPRLAKIFSKKNNKVGAFTFQFPNLLKATVKKDNVV